MGDIVRYKPYQLKLQADGSQSGLSYGSSFWPIAKVSRVLDGKCHLQVKEDQNGQITWSSLDEVIIRPSDHLTKFRAADVNNGYSVWVFPFAVLARDGEGAEASMFTDVDLKHAYYGGESDPQRTLMTSNDENLAYNFYELMKKESIEYFKKPKFPTFDVEFEEDELEVWSLSVLCDYTQSTTQNTQLKKKLTNKIFGYLARCEFLAKIGLRFWIW